jgi:hypothetical protein
MCGLRGGKAGKRVAGRVDCKPFDLEIAAVRMFI